MNVKYLFLFLIAGLIAFIPISCDIKNPVEGIGVRIKNIPRTTTVRVEFIEQNTGRVINSPITVKFSGKDKDKIISDVNVPITQINTSNGFAYFAIKDNVEPTINNPVEFIVVVEGQSFISTSQRIIITKKGSNAFVVNLLRLSGQLPAGITTQTQNFGNVATSSGTTATIVGSSGGTISSRITVPAGTVLKDANGNALSGAVSTEITYFDPSNRSAITSFPGGFTVNAQGSGNGGFVSAAFSSINMRVGDRQVESFSQPVSVQMGINPNVVNPTTGTTVRPGDVIPLWSYNESNGTWKFEGNYTVNSKVGQGGTQELFVEKNDVTHLSWYNLDWFYNSCNISSTFNIVGGCWQNLFWYLEYQNGQGYIGSGWVYHFDPSLTFLYAPSNIPVKLSLFSSVTDFYNYYYNNNTSGIVGSLNINNLCAGPSQVFNVNVNTNVTGQDINVTVRGRCPNGNIIDQGTLDLEILKDGYWSFAGRIVNGQILLRCLQIGQTYQFRVYYDGVYYTHTQTITSNNMLVEIQLQQGNDLCN